MDHSRNFWIKAIPDCEDIGIYDGLITSQPGNRKEIGGNKKYLRVSLTKTQSAGATIEDLGAAWGITIVRGQESRSVQLIKRTSFLLIELEKMGDETNRWRSVVIEFTRASTVSRPVLEIAYEESDTPK
jgi:hypothetical protein